MTQTSPLALGASPAYDTPFYNIPIPAVIIYDQREQRYRGVVGQLQAKHSPAYIPLPIVAEESELKQTIDSITRQASDSLVANAVLDFPKGIFHTGNQELDPRLDQETYLKQIQRELVSHSLPKIMIDLLIGNKEESAYLGSHQLPRLQEYHGTIKLHFYAADEATAKVATTEETPIIPVYGTVSHRDTYLATVSYLDMTFSGEGSILLQALTELIDTLSNQIHGSILNPNRHKRSQYHVNPLIPTEMANVLVGKRQIIERTIPLGEVGNKAIVKAVLFDQTQNLARDMGLHSTGAGAHTPFDAA